MRSRQSNAAASDADGRPEQLGGFVGPQPQRPVVGRHPGRRAPGQLQRLGPRPHRHRARGHANRITVEGAGVIDDQLLRIEQVLGNRAKFPGKAAFKI